MLQPGDRIGPLRVERALGAGGMGEVWLARDERLERLVAVKLLPAESSLDPAARGRMLREARAASALKHPGIVTVHDIGDHEHRAYIVMEYVEGETFDVLVKRRGPLRPPEAVELVAQVADAVAIAHAAGILHRDLKAQNLMLDDAGRVKVLDFGLSKRTSDGMTTSQEVLAPTPDDSETAMAATVAPDAATTPAPALISRNPVTGRTDEPLTAHGVRMGTPGWAPPELMDGGVSDVRSDVFALGAVLYHLLTGSMPFPAATWGALREQIERGPQPPSAMSPGVPRALDAVISGALAADPEKRPASARAFVAAARAALAPARSRVPVLVGAGAAAAIGVGALMIAGRGSDHARSRTAAGPAATSADAAVTDASTPPATPVQLTTLGGCAYLPAFLDEDTLTFDLTRDGTVDLYTLDLQHPGGAPVRRTSAPGWEWRSTRGRTDREIVFLEQTPDHQGFASVFDLDQGTVTRLFPASGPIAPVGDVYFHAPGVATTLRRRDAARDEVFLTLETDLAVDSIVPSPDGRTLAMLVFGESQLARMCTTPTAQPALRCFEMDVASARPAWSPDNRHVYVHAKRGLQRVDATTGVANDVIKTIQPFGGLAISPSGATLVYSGCNTRSHLHATNGPDPKTPIVEDDYARYPQFGPDRQLGFVSGGLANAHVMVRDATGPLREVVSHGEARITGLAFSDDGQYIAYAVGNAAEPGIYVSDVGGDNTRNRITDQDGDREPVILGDAIYFMRDDASGAPRMMRVSFDGSNVEMASNRPRRTLAVDRRLKRVLLASPGLDFLYWWDPVTGKESPGPVLPRPMGDIGISPDGRWLLVVVGENGERAVRVRLDQPGKPEPEEVYTSPGDVTGGEGAIDDDGLTVIEVTTWAGELWKLDPPTGSRW
ncbi:MAG TPA: protein kinase [Kofleriaceae bacterium]|nr:protein kinase [Kofleriaceae bacterium]